MSIDWITVAAQIANFLALIWLLRRFLYRPILDGIDAREREIAENMAKAGRIEATAQAAQADFAARAAALEAERGRMLEEARAEAAAARDALLAAARERVAQEQAEIAARRAEEARRYAATLRRTGMEALLALTRKALSDLSGETLEGRIVAHAAPRLQAMTARLHEAGGEGARLTVLTRDPLPNEVREALAHDLAALSDGTAPAFRTDPSQSPGLTLRLGGAQVAWTVDAYAEGLQEVLDARLDGAATEGADAA